MTPVERAVLHVGVQKTGTTTIQWALRRLRNRELPPAGIAYVDRRDISRLPHLRRSAAYPRGNWWGRRAYQRELEELAEQRLRDTPGAHTLLVSDESMVGVPDARRHVETPFRPRAEATVRQALAALPGRRVDLVVYLRRQDRFIESLYMHRIHSGETLPFEDYARDVLARPWVLYGDLLDRLAAIPGVDSVTVRPFELIGGGATRFVADFLDGAGIEGVSVDRLHTIPQQNPSYSAPALDIAIRENGQFDTREARQGFRNALELAFPAGEHPRPRLLSDEQRLAVIEAYAADNRAVFERWMPDFPADSYGSVEATDRLGTALTHR